LLYPVVEAVISYDYEKDLDAPLVVIKILNKIVHELTLQLIGPVTDYGATITHWQHDRAPGYKGGYTGEAERPSVSYIVDVSHPSTFDRCV
jgi:hypothetical protein